MKKILTMILLMSCMSVFAENHKGHSNSKSMPETGVRKITIVNYEIKGVKQWNPGTIIAKHGETVKLTLKNTAGAVHGFFIPAYNIKENIKKGATNKVSFKATKKGLFEIKCHLHHPAHIGGQLLIQ